MVSEGIDISNLRNRIEWLEKDCTDYQNKIKTLSDLFGELSYNYKHECRQREVLQKENDKKFNLILRIQDFYKENDRMSKKQFMEILNNLL